ncbi:serine/threonine-protein phosphatase 7 long form homolog [Amaranthus tricolor]|uniref:serine/threonine-protein phosphatase 7 long form homolog n=1 Tax=Amaranthus tricolor TaxID=29722 RepID=UPI002585FB56|nr:serine/threonine-protein phosphatase 7 long form homolog [Amaranthus tricolor]
MAMPDPVDPSVLTFQATHRSLAAWEGSTTQFRARSSSYNFISGEVEAGDSYIPPHGWRGTLQDVAVILGLAIEGQAVIGHEEGHWPNLVHKLLGVRPENPQDPTKPKIITGSSLKLTWLREHFSVLEDDADDVTVERHACAYILYLFGCIMFPDKSGDSVQLMYLPQLGDLEWVDEYSWGSATLAYLYRNLCRASREDAKDIGGCLLLQKWFWEHIHIGRPIIRTIRPAGQQDQDDDAEDYEPLASRISFEMTWQPYTTAKMDALPHIRYSACR